MKFRKDRPLAEMRAVGVRGEHLAPWPVPRQAAEYFSSIPVGDRTGEVLLQRYCDLASAAHRGACLGGKKARPLVSLHRQVFA